MIAMRMVCWGRLRPHFAFGALALGLSQILVGAPAAAVPVGPLQVSPFEVTTPPKSGGVSPFELTTPPASGAAPAEAPRQQVAPPVVKRIQNQDRTFTPGADYDTVIERGWMSFGVYDDFAPYSWVDDGEVKGLDVELGRLIAEGLGVEARFTVMGADESVDDDLRNYVWKGPLIGGDVVNVMLHVPYDREFKIRNELVVLTGLYMAETIAIAYRTDMHPEDPPTPAYFVYDTVGVENDSVADFYLSSLSGGRIIPKMTRYRTVDLAMAGLAAGEVSAVMGPRAQLEHGVADGVEVHSPPIPGLAIGTWSLGAALRHNYRQLAYAVDDEIQSARADGRMQALFDRFGVTYKAPKF